MLIGLLKIFQSFNSSQVDSKPGQNSLRRKLKSSFNSSQVDSKPGTKDRNGEYVGKFQFLIGRLKTKIKAYLKEKGISVSIPHRQTQNVDSATITFLKREFQFLIGRLKTAKIFQRNLITIMFQFLIGRLKTFKLKNVITKQLSFNSSQVDSKLQYQAVQIYRMILVSIPHRQTQNKARVLGRRKDEIVSIPHRQTQNA